MTDQNKITEEIGGEGSDWRADVAAALGRDRDPRVAGRRPRGRPKGSTNRKTQDFASWYEAQGFKDPLQLQAEFMSADPVALQSWFIEFERTQKAIGKMFGQAVPSLSEIVEQQMAIANKIAPYLHGKAPVRVVVEDERLPVLVINAGTNQIDQARQVLGNRLSAGRPLVELTSNKINDLAEAQSESPTTKSPTEGKCK